VSTIDNVILGQLKILVRDQLPQREALDLKMGEVVEGKVLRLLEDGRAVLSLKGREIVARPKVALAPGEEILARVQSLGREIVLSLFSRQGRVQARVLRILAKTLQSARSFTSLSAELAALSSELKASGTLSARDTALLQRIVSLIGPSSEAEAAAIEARLASLANVIGLSYEALVAQSVVAGGPILLLKRRLQGVLKPNLARLIARLSQRLLRAGPDDQGSKARLEELLTLCRSLFDQIEFTQLANQFLARFGAAAYLKLPLLVRGQTGLAELLIRSMREDSQDGKINPNRCQITLVVDLSGLGRARVVATIADRSMSCLVATQAEEAKEYISKHSDELVSALKAAGYHLAPLQCIVSAEPLGTLAESLASAFVSESPAFDVTV